MVASWYKGPLPLLPDFGDAIEHRLSELRVGRRTAHKFARYHDVMASIKLYGLLDDHSDLSDIVYDVPSDSGFRITCERRISIVSVMRDDVLAEWCKTPVTWWLMGVRADEIHPRDFSRFRSRRAGRSEAEALADAFQLFAQLPRATADRLNLPPGELFDKERENAHAAF